VLLTVSAAITDTGLVREVNEDDLLTAPGLFVVADGMGGHAAGDVASSLAVEALRRLAEAGTLTPDDLLNALESANDAIVGRAAANAEQAGMGTTVAGLGVVELAGGTHWIAFNIGDSRVYRLSGGGLEQLTVDHSEVQELVTAGAILPEEARVHPRRNVVTRCLGSSPAPIPDVWVFPAEAGERFLICSDGLTSELSDAAIFDVFSADDDPDIVARALIHEALAAGGRDNVTVIVVNHVETRDRELVDETTTPRRRSTGNI
jgi:serine/threonine protein phosphatase PrpC